MPRRRSKRRRIRPDPELERRRADELARRLVLEANRQRRISRPAMARHETFSPFVRCLYAFYGEQAVDRCHANPEDVPARLGRAREFWLEWESWKKIAADRVAATNETKAAAAAKLGSFF